MPATNRVAGTLRTCIVSTKPVWGPVIELVDLRYRPEVNTIGALTESDSSEHVPFAGPIWTTTPEESGLVFCRERSRTCGRSDNNMQHNMAKTDHKHSISGHVSKAREKQGVIFGSALWEWSSCVKSCCEYCLEPT